MRFFLVCTLSAFLCMQTTSACAQLEKEIKLQEEYEEFTEQYKKTHKLKFVMPKKEGDFLYFFTFGKKWIRGVINKEGKVIVPTQYDMVEYFPPKEEGTHVIENGKKIVWNSKTEGSFVAHNYKKRANPHYTIYKTDGTVVFDMEVEAFYDYIPGYFLIKVADKKQSNNSLWGLYTSGGNEILPIECEYITFHGKVCKYAKMIGEISHGGTYMKGALMLDGSLPNIPCQFSDVEYDSINHQWLVQKEAISKWEVYSTNKHYITEMKDDGVRLFWEGKYDETIKFYSGIGISQPWAKFYTGAAMIKKAEKQYYKCLNFIDDVQNNRINSVASNGVSNRKLYMNLEPDFELMKQLYTTGYSILEAYLCEDSTFLEEVNEITSTRLDWRLEWLDNTKVKFTPYWNEFQKENAAIAAHQEELRREKQEREKAIYQAIITGFMNGINNAISGNTTRQSNNVSTSRANVSTNVGVYNSNTTNTQNTSSSSNTRTINHSALADWKARKANAERMIREYNEQLLRNPNDAAIKSMIRSQENILNNCIRQISLIESGAY